MSVWGIILAAGGSTRLSKVGLGVKKQFLTYKEKPLFWHSAELFARIARFQGIVLVFPQDDFLTAQETVIDLDASQGLGLPWLAVPGGTLRQDSVFEGLKVIPDECRTVLVHDAARPFASPQMVNAMLDRLESGASAVIPAVPVKDTIKRVKDDIVQTTLPREELRAVQTPQGFDFRLLYQAHRQARQQGWEVTDDASLIERLDETPDAPKNLEVCLVPGEESNIKITTPEDLAALEEQAPIDFPSMIPCIGWGYDVHRYAPGRPLKLGGIPIPKGPEVAAHSDGDVLMHALTDALLGLLGAGDIGDRFPDTDAAFENMSSAIFLDEVLHDVREAGILLCNIDVTLICQTPKLKPYKEQIQKNLARLLSLEPSQVGVKATTEEGLGFTGEKKGIKATAAAAGLRPIPDGLARRLQKNPK